MKQKQRIAWITGGALAGLVLLLGIPRRSTQTTPTPPIAASAPESVPAPPPPHATPERLAAQLARREQGAWGPDPFAPALPVSEDGTPVAAVVEPLRLQGISRAGSAWMALIGGELVQEGERLSTGHAVEAITDAAVTLEKDGQTLTLRLGENR